MRKKHSNFVKYHIHKIRNGFEFLFNGNDYIEKQTMYANSKIM